MSSACVHHKSVFTIRVYSGMINKSRTILRVKLLTAYSLLAMLLTTQAPAASDPDLHWLWDDRCATCHGHAGDFARNFLSVVDGQLQGRHHLADLRLFLHNHNLRDAEVDDIYTMLLAQTTSQARFRNACSGCHETAAQFVRAKLKFRDGVLYGDSTGRPVQVTLESHRKLTASDRDFFIKLLLRVAREVYRP